MLTPPRREWYYVGVEEHKTHSTGRVHTLAAVAVNKYGDVKSEMFVFFVLTAQDPANQSQEATPYFIFLLSLPAGVQLWCGLIIVDNSLLCKCFL